MKTINNMMSNNVYFDADVSHCNTSIGFTSGDWNVYYAWDADSLERIVIEGVSKSDAMRFCKEHNSDDDACYFYRHRNK